MSAALHFREVITTIALATCGAAPLALAQQPVTAKTARSKPLARKDPEVATILGVVIPGAGQVYTERYGKAAMIMGGTAAGVAIAIDVSSRDCNPAGHCNNNAVEVVSIAGAAALWAFGWVTAGADARLHNNQMLNQSSFAPFVDEKNGRLVAGLTLRMP